MTTYKIAPVPLKRLLETVQAYRYKFAINSGPEGTALIAAIANATDCVREAVEYADTIEKARECYEIRSDDLLEIDDYPLVSPGEDGCWVAAWVWVVANGGEDEEED